MVCLDFTNVFEQRGVLLLGPMGEVDAEDIAPRIDEFSKHIDVGAGRSDCRHDLGSGERHRAIVQGC